MQPLDQGTIYCLKRTLQKCLQHFLLQDIERNISATDIKKWNVMDAMQGIAVV
jgi:hypothetical protein